MVTTQPIGAIGGTQRDTGWRNVTATFNLDQCGIKRARDGIYIRRINNTVYLRFSGIEFKDDQKYDKCWDFPQGFGSGGSDQDNQFTAFWSDTDRSSRGMLALREGRTLLVWPNGPSDHNGALLSFLTVQSWPDVMPGM